jgi:hypothetical protein
MSVLRLPEPDNWPTGRRRFVVVTLVSAAFVTLGVLFGIRAVLRGDYYVAAMLFGLQVPIVMTLIAIHLVARGHTALNTDVDSTGTTFRADRTFTWIMLLAFATSIPLGIFYVTCTLSGDLVMFTSPRGRLGSVVSMATVTVISSWGLISAWRRGGVGFIKLTPVGVEIADILRTKLVAWHEVDAVTDDSESKKTRKAIVLERGDGAEHVIEGPDFYVPEGAGLFWMVRHYWSHPDDRAELADHRGLQRLREARFDVG